MNVYDIRQVLRWLDRESEYPPGSQQPYLASVLPKAIANDFQFADYAESIDESYRAQCRKQFGNEESGENKTGMSMAIFHSIIKLLLLELESLDDKALVIDKKMIERNVNAVVVNLR